MIPEDLQQFPHPQMNSDRLRSLVRDSVTVAAITSFDGFGLISAVEEAFERNIGVTGVSATNSGTSALYAAYAALGLRAGDEVITPAYTFFATVMPLFRLGCRPILADCLDNGNIDPADIERRISPQTRAIVVTHMWGIPCDMHEILAIARRHGLKLIEDASHAHGATLDGTPLGSFGDAAGWSLGARKIVTGGQGGMLRADSTDVLQQALLLTRANDKTHDNLIVGSKYEPYAVTGSGMNLRMHPFAASLITDQLEGLERQLTERRAATALFLSHIADQEVLRPVRVPAGAAPSWYAIPLLLHDAIDPAHREALVSELHAEGATDVDVPGSTRPLLDFSVFTDAIPSYDHAPSAPHARKDYPRAASFQQRIIKYPAWYGPRATEYALEYARATRRVIDRFTSRIA